MYSFYKKKTYLLICMVILFVLIYYTYKSARQDLLCTEKQSIAYPVHTQVKLFSCRCTKETIVVLGRRVRLLIDYVGTY